MTNNKKKKLPITKTKNHASIKSKSISSKHTKSIINRFHHLLKIKSKISNNDELLKINKEIDQLGGLEAYQQASTIGQSNDRGGDSSHVFIKWLIELKLRDDYLSSNKKLKLVASLFY